MTDIYLYFIVAGHRSGSLKISSTSTVCDLRRSLAEEARIPLLETRLMRLTDDDQLVLQTDDSAIVKPGTYIVCAADQLLIIFGDLEPRLASLFETLLDVQIPSGARIEREICFYYPPKKTYKVVTLIITRPLVLTVRDQIMSVALQGRKTEVVFLCHSLDAAGLLLGGGVVPMKALSGMSPITANYSVEFNMQTCFAANYGYIRVLLEDSSNESLTALQNLGGVGHRITAHSAVLSIVDLLNAYGFRFNSVALDQLEGNDFSFYLEKWKWPHTRQYDAGKKEHTRVLEQFGETFHIAVLVAIYPDIIGKFLQPPADEDLRLYDEVMNYEQYQYLQIIHDFALRTISPTLITPASEEFVSKQTVYSHSNGSALIVKIRELDGFIYGDTLNRVRKRLVAGVKPSAEPGKEEHILLVVRISTAGKDTNSNVRDTPVAIINKVLSSCENVVVVGNQLPASVMQEFGNKPGIVFATEIWQKEEARLDNKYIFQMQHYANLRTKYNIVCGVGMWSGALDMFSLLGIPILRVFVSQSCVSRISDWSNALGMHFKCISYEEGEDAIVSELLRLRNH